MAKITLRPGKRWRAKAKAASEQENSCPSVLRLETSRLLKLALTKGNLDRASAKLDEMVAALGEVDYADIEIQLFQVEIDGTIFGLVDVSEPEEGPAFAERVAMMPGDLLFHAPWNGNYDT